MLIPAAPAWPPNLVRWALQAPSASNRFTPGTVRAEPRPSPSLKPIGDRRARELVDQTRGDDPDHPLVPPLGTHHHGGRVGLRGRLGARLHPDQLLDPLPLGVLVVDRRRPAARRLGGSRQQEIERQLGLAEPPGRVEPWASAETPPGER